MVVRLHHPFIHSTLGMKPIDRFGVDLARIRFLSPSEDTDERFYAEAERSVQKDNTFSFGGRRYETPIDLRGRELQLRHERHTDGWLLPLPMSALHRDACDGESEEQLGALLQLWKEHEQHRLDDALRSRLPPGGHDSGGLAGTVPTRPRPEAALARIEFIAIVVS
jgi:hypothetical protein